MAIFGSIEVDSLAQVNEKVRLDGSKTFITQDEAAITLVEIEPHTGDGYITVFTTLGAEPIEGWYLDWKYSSVGTKTASIRITTSGAPQIFSTTVEVIDSATDALFASDLDLIKFEPDIMKWLPHNKSTWNFVHRKVQDKILTEIYKQRIFATDGSKLTKVEVVDKTEVREWATYMALSIIFSGIQNAIGDVFSEKAKMYERKSNEYMQYSMNVLALDYNKDGSISNTEKYDLRSGGLIRR